MAIGNLRLEPGKRTWVEFQEGLRAQGGISTSQQVVSVEFLGVDEIAEGWWKKRRRG